MATDTNTTRYSVRVPLGDADHKEEEKGSTKFVKRRLLGMKGKAGSRTAIVFWRSQHYIVAERSEKPGSFETTKKAAKSDFPDGVEKAKKGAAKKSATKSSADKTVAVSKTAKTPKKAAKKSAAKGKSSKESDQRAA